MLLSHPSPSVHFTLSWLIHSFSSSHGHNVFPLCTQDIYHGLYYCCSSCMHGHYPIHHICMIPHYRNYPSHIREISLVQIISREIHTYHSEIHPDNKGHCSDKVYILFTSISLTIPYHPSSIIPLHNSSSSPSLL